MTDIVPFGYFDDCYTRSFRFLFENRIIVVKCNKTRNIVQYIFLVRDPHSNIGFHQLLVETKSNPHSGYELLPKYHRFSIWNDSVLLMNIPTLISMLNLGIMLSLDCFWENVKKGQRTPVRDFNIGYLPDTRLLNSLCKLLGRKSAIIRVFCSEICLRIQKEYTAVIEVRAAYVPGKENEIVFVVITKNKCESPTIQDRPIVHRCIDDMSKEASHIIKNERAITAKQRNEMRAILDRNTKTLLKKHTNITLISISSIKSKGFNDNGISKSEYTPCIVFYVPVKGLIPVDEDILPNLIDGYKTDIREGAFTPYVLTSRDIHEKVKMGCLIQGLPDNTDTSGNIQTGTLGGFIDHPQFGLCCFTSAHVILSDNDMSAIGRGVSLQPTNDLSCYQPYHPHRFGSIVLAVCEEGNANCPGVEVVMIKIENRQIDNHGRFPGTEDIAYWSGKILELDEIRQLINTTETYVIKYGAETGITKGKILNDMTTTCFKHGNLNFTLQNQVAIYGVKFAEAGDSGALVFHCHENMPLSVIGVIEGGTNFDTCLVTPICAVLKSLGLSPPLQMKAFENVPYEQRKLENMEERICRIEKTSERLESEFNAIQSKLDKIISFFEKG
ncbi:uncharacterized protein LOC132742680 [Ruditapes philippinarum]|uniref:uncharacterized protein LOC132742680 n=1 Tax=Ruditapes philippinarum TaxID=129788 RepID=UPI00295B1159|nr:uncharacterized protein LOC132742680 [Ruditapes philippinarum]